MTQKPRKTRKMTAGDTLITRAELQFFAKAVDARIAQEIGKVSVRFCGPMIVAPDGGQHVFTGRGWISRSSLTDDQFMAMAAHLNEHAWAPSATVPTDSEGAE